MKDSMHLGQKRVEDGKQKPTALLFLGPQMDAATHCIKAALKELVPLEDEDATTQH